ncbi:unnamed protein product [Effrenium voratum]|uniref:Uncharacterized protein n=1 Tax=Effrenium voratum TaxID=2562239 RepID=A0AA36N293_9DINO|nr:unnamed protein product [Effrenium voratum]
MTVLLEAKPYPGQERSLALQLTSAAFFRAEAQPARDLGVLAASSLRRLGYCSVLELFAGCGVRAARYLLEGGVDFVWANEANQDVHDLVLGNLRAAAAAAGGSASARDRPCGQLLPEWAAPARSWRLKEGLSLHGRQGGDHPGWQDEAEMLADKDSASAAKGWRATHWESKSMLGYCQASNRQFDLVDVDAFGCWAHLAAALETVRPGGVLYLTCTGLTAWKPSRSFRRLRVRGQCPPPETLHEHMARAVIWHTVSSADQLGLAAQPLLTLYRASGDVYRVMFRITRRFGESRLISKSVGQCQVCGAYVGPFEEDALYGTPARRPRCCGSDALVCWGPLWMGGLHSDEFIHELQQDASDRGWLDDETPIPGTDSLGDLLAKLLSEARAEAAAQASGEALAPWTLRVRELARRAKSSPPKLKALMEELSSLGHVACRSAFGPEHFRTSAPAAAVVAALVKAKALKGLLMQPFEAGGYAVALATILEATSSNVTLSERNLREFKVNAKLPAPAHLQNLKETADKIAGIQEKLRGEYLKNKGIHNVHHSDARQAEIAQCVFSALLASHQLASGAMSITAGVSTCGYGGVPAKIEACTANIGATLATLAGAAAFLTEVSIQCPHTLDHRDADCASSIETLISGLGGVAAHAAGAAQSCGNIPNGATIFNPVSVNDETGMANCILNTNQAAFFAARAGIQTDGLANGACGRDKSAADCSMSVTGALTSFASLGHASAGF